MNRKNFTPNQKNYLAEIERIFKALNIPTSTVKLPERIQQRDIKTLKDLTVTETGHIISLETGEVITPTPEEFKTNPSRFVDDYVRKGRHPTRRPPTLTKEQRSEIAKKQWANLTPDERAYRMSQIRRNISRKIKQGMPEQRARAHSARGQTSQETREILSQLAKERWRNLPQEEKDRIIDRLNSARGKRRGFIISEPPSDIPSLKDMTIEKFYENIETLKNFAGMNGDFGDGFTQLMQTIQEAVGDTVFADLINDLIVEGGVSVGYFEANYFAWGFGFFVQTLQYAYVRGYIDAETFYTVFETGSDLNADYLESGEYATLQVVGYQTKLAEGLTSRRSNDL